MRQSPQVPKSPSNIPAPLHQQLNMYALAASAAGVGFLALAQPAEGEIVYTPANVKIGINSTIHLDLNHDGTNDFDLKDFHKTYSSGPKVGLLSVAPARRANEAWGYLHGTHQLASALPAGHLIAANRHFHPGTDRMVEGSVSGMRRSTCVWQWANVTNRYLALKFVIKGKVHFGWARLSVSCTPGTGAVTGTLTGYAYETMPGKSLRTGQKTDDPGENESVSTNQSEAALKASAPRRDTLGLLALGAPALSIWRREQTITA
jgi:hypothetical protein